MKIESVRIENFRGFKDETICLSDYNCFVGRNGSGKSTILYALNVFFRQYKDASTDLSRLAAEDFHHKNTNSPIKITVTFSDLTAEAERDLADYVRQGKLAVSAVAQFDPRTERAEVKQYGNRLGFTEFRTYFEAEKTGEKVAELKERFRQLRMKYPGIKGASTKADMAAALQEYEAAHPDECDLIPSEDQFYGVSRGANRLAPHIQWVFIPASKDLTEEADESKTSALGQLLARTVRSSVDFTEKLADLKQRVQTEYQNMLEEEQTALDQLSASLEARLREWAHPDVSTQVLWNRDAEKSVTIQEPWATIRLGERGFVGELPRFGHGLQRSYLLALLQELSVLGSESQPTLVMGIEEPELYQHPPQGRHLAEVLITLSQGDAQVLCCSHSPLFIPGDNVEAVRLVRESGEPCQSTVSYVTYKTLTCELERVGEKLLTESGLTAKLYPTLNPTVNEMFFCDHLVLVEGFEDVAHILTYLELLDLLEEYRRTGTHMVPVGGKSEMIKPLAIALNLKLPVYVIFDADTDKTKESEKKQHRKNNRSLQMLLGIDDLDEWPKNDMKGMNYRIWSTNLTDTVQRDLGSEWITACREANDRYDRPGQLQKNPLAIAYAHKCAWEAGARSTKLEDLARGIVRWASDRSDWQVLPADAKAGLE